jgi:hypothetical protein
MFAAENLFALFSGKSLKRKARPAFSAGNAQNAVPIRIKPIFSKQSKTKSEFMYI